MQRTGFVSIIGAATLRTWLMVCLVSLCAAPGMADQWPRFRGPNGTGISDLQGLPVAWSEDDYEWVVDLPGIGHSSPVIWDDALFLTTALDDGSRTVHRFDALTGEEVWSQTTRFGTPRIHKKSSLASTTPALDGERLYVAFADETHQLVIAYTFDGDVEWTRDLGAYTSQHGLGVSPIVYGELLVMPNEQAGESSIVALNRKTGEVVWKHPRPSKEVSYATPMILDLPDHAPQLICLGQPGGLVSLNPLTGDAIWSTSEMPQRTVSSPVYGNGVIIASSGQGGVGKYLRAVSPTGAGDVTGTHIRFERMEKEFLNYVPTPIVRGEYLYLWCDRGIVCCVELPSGRTIWNERVGGNYSGSPVSIDGKLYCVSEEGEVVVLAAAPEFQEYGRSPLGDGSHSTPAVANGRLYLRGFQRLVSLRAKAVVEDAGVAP